MRFNPDDELGAATLVAKQIEAISEAICGNITVLMLAYAMSLRCFEEAMRTTRPDLWVRYLELRLKVEEAVAESVALERANAN